MCSSTCCSTENPRFKVRPVLEGHRLVITYNLLVQSQMPVKSIPSAADLTGSRDNIRRLLTQWNDGFDQSPMLHPKRLLYRLDYQYSDASLCFAALKGIDSQRGRALQVAAETGLANIYLANVERIRLSDEEDSSLDEDGGIQMCRLVTLDGVEIGTRVTCDETDFIQYKPYLDHDADESEHEGYTGNEGAPITYTYRDTVCFLSLPMKTT